MGKHIVKVEGLAPKEIEKLAFWQSRYPEFEEVLRCQRRPTLTSLSDAGRFKVWDARFAKMLTFQLLLDGSSFLELA